MQSKVNRHEAFEPTIEYTKKPVSGWGGLVSFVRFWDRIGLREALGAALPDGRTSPNQVRVVDQVLQLMVTVLIGGQRFEHVERVRSDEVVKQIVGAKRFGSASSLTRYLGNFLQSQTEHAHQTLNSMVMRMLPGLASSDVLDLDSTVFSRYGDQEGSTKGYNPHRRGARSHQPLLAMFAGLKVIAHAWLRAGSASPHRGCEEFVKEVLAQIPGGFKISAVRADAGFYSRNFLALLEEHGLRYAIRAQMSPGLKRWCAGLKGWASFGPDVEITESNYASPKDRVPRRLVVIRKTIRRISSGVLFEIIDYEYWAIVTNMNDDSASVWSFYNKRGDCENRIKELKYDFNADGFCLQRFAGTEAAFRLICFTFNLVALFKHIALRDPRTTLATIRTKLFVIGASIGSSGRRTILRLGLIGRWKQEFDRLLATIDHCGGSTAPQFTKAFVSCDLETPSPWRLRRDPMLALIVN